MPEMMSEVSMAVASDKNRSTVNTLAALRQQCENKLKQRQRSSPKKCEQLTDVCVCLWENEYDVRHPRRRFLSSKDYNMSTSQ